MTLRNKPTVIAVIGTKKSGKTSLIAFLMSSLTEKGLKIGSVKHVPKANFTLDKPNTDTWRYVKSGAKVAVCVSRDELATIRRTKTVDRSLEEILNLLRGDEVDLVFLEGFRYLVAGRRDVPKILTAKNLEDLKDALGKITPPVLAAVGRFKGQTVFRGIPLLDLEREGGKLLLMVEGCLRRSPSRES